MSAVQRNYIHTIVVGYRYIKIAKCLYPQLAVCGLMTLLLE